MTDHYAEASRLLNNAADADPGANPAHIALLLQFAQIHATLAQADTARRATAMLQQLNGMAAEPTAAVDHAAVRAADENHGDALAERVRQVLDQDEFADWAIYEDGWSTSDLIEEIVDAATNTDGYHNRVRAVEAALNRADVRCAAGRPGLAQAIAWGIAPETAQVPTTHDRVAELVVVIRSAMDGYGGNLDLSSKATTPGVNRDELAEHITEAIVNADGAA